MLFIAFACFCLLFLLVFFTALSLLLLLAVFLLAHHTFGLRTREGQ